MGTLADVALIVLGLVLLALVLSIPYMLRQFRRVITIESSLPIGKMMQRAGVSPDDAAGREYELTVAASRCGSCKSVDACREWLAVEGRGGAAAFCPNAPFLNTFRHASGGTRAMDIRAQ